VAQDVEAAFAQSGRLVLSNASSYRMAADVPLVTPDVNADHLTMLDSQRSSRGWTGGIVTNANCSSIVAVSALAPLHRAFGITRLFVSTMQAVSGAGYPGVASLDILGNVIPFIRNEEEKIETEILKMLGRMHDGHVSPADLRISSHANRVPVLNGHTLCMSMDFAGEVTPEQAANLNITFFDADRVPIGQGEMPAGQGSAPWTKRHTRLKVPRAARLAVVAIGLFGATGQARFDQVELHPIGMPSAGLSRTSR